MKIIIPHLSYESSVSLLCLPCPLPSLTLSSSSDGCMWLWKIATGFFLSCLAFFTLPYLFLLPVLFHVLYHCLSSFTLLDVWCVIIPLLSVFFLPLFFLLLLLLWVSSWKNHSWHSDVSWWDTKCECWLRACKRRITQLSSLLASKGGEKYMMHMTRLEPDAQNM